jgi:signal transduction histidine kinase
MEGFNDEWIDAGTVPEATYTNLSPGNYTFKVFGCNSANVWSPEPASMAITILPPWWGTWWFRLAVILVIASGIYAFYRYRLQQALKLQHLRNRIASDLHDEIGSTLSSISLAGSVIQRKLQGSAPEVESLLTRIGKNTDSMMEAMSDIVWAVNTKNDRFDNVVRRMRAFAIERLEPENITFHFQVDNNLNQLQLDMQQRKNLYLIFKEAIHNAAKYAACKNVWVDIGLHGSALTIRIKDDGQGFDVSSAKDDSSFHADGEASTGQLGGNGLNNMQRRAEELKGKLTIKSAHEKGTTVEVCFNV